MKPPPKHEEKRNRKMYDMEEVFVYAQAAIEDPETCEGPFLDMLSKIDWAKMQMIIAALISIFARGMQPPKEKEPKNG